MNVTVLLCIITALLTLTVALLFWQPELVAFAAASGLYVVVWSYFEDEWE